jgi:hypothetical protein
MYTCKYCGRITESVNSNSNHQIRCSSNSERSVQRSATGRPLGTKVLSLVGKKWGAAINGHTIETKQRLSVIAKERNLGGYVQGSGRGKKGWYKGFFCDSSWELAYVVYCLEHNIDIKRNTEKRQYIWQGVVKNYLPDFIVEGTLTEVKGYKTEQWLAKLKANPDVRVLYEKDLEPVLEYVKGKYGKDFINLYE